MTREEAIKAIKSHCYFANLVPVGKEALDMAIEALQTEPCEDAISREELLKAMDTRDKFGYTETGCFVREPKNNCVKYIHYDDVIKCIKGMLPVKPQEPKTDTWSIKDVADTLAKHGLIVEQEPCGKDINVPATDAISRQAVINTLFYSSDNNCDVVLSTKLMDKINRLPPVTPKQKTGKWIKKMVRGSEELYCSNCGDGIDVIYEYNFCPNCGAKMGGEKHE